MADTATTFAGIHDENEFYSHHYLFEIFTGDIRDTVARRRELGLQSLRYMYRLLFLFYIEARPDLGYAPIEAEAYRKGYGLERLRDLEMVRLTSEESLDGYYLHHSIQTLFRLGGHPSPLRRHCHPAHYRRHALGWPGRTYHRIQCSFRLV